MGKEQKERLVSNLQERLQKGKTFILTYYRGLNVRECEQLRKELRKVNAEFKVSKNTFLKLASKDTAFEVLKIQCRGPIAIALGYGDPVATAKVLVEFSKQNPELEIRAGLLEKKVLSPKDILELATLPSREVLIGRLIGNLDTPISRLLLCLNSPLRNFMSILKAIERAKASDQ